MQWRVIGEAGERAALIATNYFFSALERSLLVTAEDRPFGLQFERLK
jgi:hypothetical protein